MSERLWLESEKLASLLSWLAKKHVLYAPVRKGDSVVYERGVAPDDVVLEDACRSVVSAKGVVLGQTETLFSFDRGENGVPDVVSAPVSKKKVVAFGVRPCDARGVLELDRVFLENIDEGVYRRRREKVVLVGVACVAPDVTCFCTSVGGGPGDREGLDVLMIPVKEGFVVEVCSPVGEELLKECGVLKKVSSEQLRCAEKVVHDAEKRISRSVKTEGIPDRLEQVFGSSYWDEVSASCIGCGVCTFVCPTCHCFDMQDELARKRGARVRVWDSCMYPEYTEHASGYNPRPKRSMRLRNRMMHKYDWMVREYGFVGCTGCGRCIRECPVNIDIVEVINGAWEVVDDE